MPIKDVFKKKLSDCNKKEYPLYLDRVILSIAATCEEFSENNEGALGTLVEAQGKLLLRYLNPKTTTTTTTTTDELKAGELKEDKDKYDFVLGILGYIKGCINTIRGTMLVLDTTELEGFLTSIMAELEDNKLRLCTPKPFLELFNFFSPSNKAITRDVPSLSSPQQEARLMLERELGIALSR